MATFYAGDPRTRAEKRDTVKDLLRDPSWAGRSNRGIARQARVSPALVSAIRYELETGRYATAAGRKRRLLTKTVLRTVQRGTVTYTMELGRLAHQKARRKTQ